jgi:polyhydroxybutyrate depolymerase
VKALKLLLVGLLFLGLLKWYADSVKNRSNEENQNVILPFKILVDKKERKCFLSSSVSKLEDKNAPLVIFLHGMDGAWPNRNFTKPQYEFINKLAWDKNFIAVFPMGSQGSCANFNERSMFYSCWSVKDDRDRKFIKTLKDAVVNQYKANPEKVFLTGFSNGGYFVADYLFNGNRNQFAGYGIHSGGLPGDYPENVTWAKPVVSLSVGLKDPYQLDDMREMKKELLKLGWQPDQNLNYEEFLGTHELNREEFKNEIDFFLKIKE